MHSSRPFPREPPSSHFHRSRLNGTPLIDPRSIPHRTRGAGRVITSHDSSCVSSRRVRIFHACVHSSRGLSVEVVVVVASLSSSSSRSRGRPRARRGRGRGDEGCARETRRDATLRDDPRVRRRWWWVSRCLAMSRSRCLARARARACDRRRVRVLLSVLVLVLERTNERTNARASNASPSNASPSVPRLRRRRG